jgi:hypothetical protein
MFPAAETGDPAVLTADPLTMAELRTAADLLGDVPGVQEARVVKLRGMWFRAELQVEGEPGREDEGPGPAIGLPGVQGGSAWADPGSGGKVKYTVNVTYAAGGVDRAGLDEIKTTLADHWDADPADVAVRRMDIEPD